MKNIGRYLTISKVCLKILKLNKQIPIKLLYLGRNMLHVRQKFQCQQ